VKHHLLALCTLLACATSANGQTQAEQDAAELADTIRTFNDTFGSAVDGELTPDQITQYEALITPIMDVDVQHKYLCGLSAQASVGQAGILVALRGPAMAELRQQTQDAIVPGSLNDWMVQISQPLIIPLGQDRTLAVAINECLQRPIEYVMNIDTPMSEIN